MPPLDNPQHEKFALACATGQDHGQAYITAGYWSAESAKGKVGGAHLYKRPDIKARIAELQDRAADITVAESVLTQVWVIDKLKEIVERALDENDRLDSPIRALELLGKHLGMFVDRSEITGDITISTVIDRLKARTARLVEESETQKLIA